ncbi:hypothetical protein A9Q84_00430 [Halobacteriovorax marinus]|uniref:SRPBCC family protein n=1 Tax=Halobacteriovorax marinus TaxID=97084 RepID=A0A1Y5FBS6_9BACT|nr:hypothetical protein A9Q84_00430 [Halobacteriovorax marinus]
MKIINTAILALSVILVSCSSAPIGMITESPDEGFTKIAYEVEVSTSKDKVWKILEDYDNLSWSNTVKEAHYLNEKRSEIGMSRHCNLSDGGYIIETISKWDQGNGFSYTLDDSSDPINSKSYANWSVKGDDQKSVIRFEVHYALNYGFLGSAMNSLFAKAKFANSIKGFMHELKNHAEKKKM